MAPLPDAHPRRLSLRPEFKSAVSGAVLEIERLLSTQRSAVPDDIGATRSLSSVIWTSTQVSSFDLQRFAKARLAAIRAEGQAAPTERALVSFEHVLRTLVADNGPTPQVGSTPSGSVEIQWLVDGNLVSALFDEEGACYLLALNGQDEVLIDEEAAAGVLPDNLREELSNRLRRMSDCIVERPSLWSTSGSWR